MVSLAWSRLKTEEDTLAYSRSPVVARLDRLATVRRNVEHPLPGRPRTRSISPGLTTPENPLRIVFPSGTEFRGLMRAKTCCLINRTWSGPKVLRMARGCVLTWTWVPDGAVTERCLIDTPICFGVSLPPRA